jgi:hypothetical protein
MFSFSCSHADHGFVNIPLPLRTITVAFFTLLRRLSVLTRTIGFAVLIQPLAVAASPESPRSTPIDIAAVLPEVRDATFNVYSLVTQPVVGAAWIATVRIGIRDEGQDSRLI